jgi:hypothetical protein
MLIEQNNEFQLMQRVGKTYESAKVLKARYRMVGAPAGSGLERT